MARIAIVKVRGANDLEWTLPQAARKLLPLLGGRAMLDRLEATQGQAFMPQLTLPYLAGLGALYNEQHGTEHVFTCVDEPESKLRLDDYEMVWLTGGTSTAPAMYRVADRLLLRGVTVVLGGIHVSMLPEEAAPHATSVVIGEAEGALFELLADFDRGMADGGGELRAAGRALKASYDGGRANALSGLAIPDWRATPLADYAPWIVPVQTSRGCRNACSFCSTTRFQGVHRRHRPVAEIVHEIRTLQQKGVITPEKVVFFTDNNIVSDSDHRRGVRDTSYARALFDAIRPLAIQWVGQGEIGVAEDRALVRSMASSGCMLLLIGLESVRQGGLSSINKRSNNVTAYARHIDTLHEHGIGNIGCLIMGLDEDTNDIFEPTAEFIERYVDVPQISILTPFPGTALHRQLAREGRIIHEDWSKYDITHVVFRPRRMTAHELDAGYRWLTERIYRFSEILRRATRAALRPTLIPGMSRVGRFTAVFAPNLIYRRLAHTEESTLAHGRVVSLAQLRAEHLRTERLLPQS